MLNNNNNNNKKKNILQNWLVKSLIITVVPLLIGIIDNIDPWFDENGYFTNIFLSSKIYVIILSIIYIVYVFYLGRIEKRENNTEGELLNEIDSLNRNISNLNIVEDAYKKVFKSLNDLINISQKDINDLSKKIVQTENLELLNWNFESIANYICRDIVELLKGISRSGTDISVNIYIRFKNKENKRTNEYIKMIAHHGGDNSEPAIFYTNLLLNKKKNYQYAKIFLNKNPKIIIYPDENTVKKHFHYKTHSDNYSGEYTQYIGIPISCSSGDVVSSLEIISHHGTVIADTEKELLDIVNKYILVYRNYALLCHKIEKGLKSKGNSINKETNL